MGKLQNIWVTRPRPNSNSTVKRLNEMKLTPITTPLMAYEWLSENGDGKISCTQDLVEVDAFAVTSQAVFLANWDACAKKEICSKTLYCVGQKTGQAAKKFGATDVVVGSGNGIALGQMLRDIANRQKQELKITYLTGSPRRDGFESSIRDCHINLRVKEVYQSHYATNFPESIKYQWCSGNIHVVLLYSAHASLSLLSCLTERGKESEIKNDSKPILLCLSHDVAKPLLHCGFEIKVASQPNEASLIALLQG